MEARPSSNASRVRAHLRQNVVGYVALFVALNGAAYAANSSPERPTAPRDSVTTSSIVDRAVTARKLDRMSVGTGAVKPNSLGTRDIAEKKLNFSIVQRRVSDRCPAGAAIRRIGPKKVTCEATGGDAAGQAGGDLTGSYPDPELADDVVESRHVVDEALTGDDVDEGSLGTVPTATDFAGNLAGDVTGPQASTSIAPNTIDSDNVVDGSLTNDDIDEDTFSTSPSGSAGGDLTGTYPNPSLANGSIDSANLFSAGLTDGAAGTPTLRSLGTGANQAAAGTDPRLSDARTPTGGAGGDLTGTYPNPSLANSAVDSAAVEDGSLRLSDIAVISSSVSVPPFNLGANSCAVLQGNSGDVLAGDVILPFPPVDGTDNALGVVWSSGTQDGDGVIRFLACNNTTSTLSAGGSIPVFVLRP